MHGKCMGTSLLSQKLAQNTNNQKISLQNWTETPFAKHLVVLFVPSNRGKIATFQNNIKTTNQRDLIESGKNAW